MTPERWHLITEVFQAAVARASNLGSRPRHQRAIFVYARPQSGTFTRVLPERLRLTALSHRVSRSVLVSLSS